MTEAPSAHIALIEPGGLPQSDLAPQLRELPATVRVADVTCGFEAVLHPSPAAVVIVITESEQLSTLPARVKSMTRSPLLAIIEEGLLDRVSSHPELDDFAVVGAGREELQTRVRRLIGLHPESGEVVRRGDLAINTATCEVSLGGALVELTFKEYTLLKFLATNPGRVHTREVLLNKVWGYDYYGGDRTVDVHVRRLRSKIEDANHSFIDTVRNIGYRFHHDT